MSPADIARHRLSAQHVDQTDFASAETVVAWMGAMQAQDYPGALWSIALRTSKLTKTDIEQAILERKIIRTWPMRGTLHFLAAKDARWMVHLLAPRAIAAAAGRRRQLEIDDTVITKSRKVITKALQGGKCRTRGDLCELLDQNGIATTGQRGIHLLHHLAELGILCFGPHEGKQPTFVLMDEWIPPTPSKTKDEALGELTRRYFISHGPATLRDFSGWANLTMNDARLGLELAKSWLTSATIEGTEYWLDPNVKPAPSATYLLPGFDEYLLGYKDRSAVLPTNFSNHIVPGNNGMFLPTLVVDGQVTGTWKKLVKKTSQTLLIAPFEPLDPTAAPKPAAKRYEAYSGLSTSWKIVG